MRRSSAGSTTRSSDTICGTTRVLEPGDYQVWLRPITASEGDYRLDVERADPFTTDADLEPNDTVAGGPPHAREPRGRWDRARSPR